MRLQRNSRINNIFLIITLFFVLVDNDVEVMDGSLNRRQSIDNWQRRNLARPCTMGNAIMMEAK
jgi:hypothetical protein